MSAAAGDPSTPSSSSSPRAEDPLLEICRPRPRQWSPETHMPHFAAAFGDAVKAALFCHNRLRKARVVMSVAAQRSAPPPPWRHHRTAQQAARLWCSALLTWAAADTQWHGGSLLLRHSPSAGASGSDELRIPPDRPSGRHHRPRGALTADVQDGLRRDAGHAPARGGEQSLESGCSMRVMMSSACRRLRSVVVAPAAGTLFALEHCGHALRRAVVPAHLSRPFL